MGKMRTITLSDRAPIKIDEDAWPVIAAAKWHDGQVESQANRTASLRVRQHADGRAVVYGVYDSLWRGEEGMRPGVLLDAGADVVAAIRAVAAELGETGERLARECIADLPAEEIT